MPQKPSDRMRFDALVMAGDRGAYRRVYEENKALLEVEGAPLVAHVLRALQGSRHVDRIFVVGPRARIEAALARCSEVWGGPSEVVVLDQWGSVIENAWNGFLATLPRGDERWETLDEDALARRFGDRVVLILGADTPLLTAGEVDEFVERGDLARYDYIVGMTSEESLRFYYPQDGAHGIHFAYFCFRESKERQNNMHLVRVFRVMNRQVPQLMYRFRYQKRVRNILKLAWVLIRLPGFSPAMIVRFALLHLCRLLDARSILRPVQRVLRRFLDKPTLERDVSALLQARLGSVVTSYGGAALDVDNEDHFQVIRKRFRSWREHQLRLKAGGRAPG